MAGRYAGMPAVWAGYALCAVAFAGLAAVLFARGDMAGAADAGERAVGLDAGVPLLWGNLALALRWLPLAETRARAA